MGAAFLVEPAAGILPPWGVMEISVMAYNDTPGRYTDKLECVFTGIFSRRCAGVAAQQKTFVPFSIDRREQRQPENTTRSPSNTACYKEVMSNCVRRNGVPSLNTPSRYDIVNRDNLGPVLRLYTLLRGDDISKGIQGNPSLPYRFFPG